MIEMPVGKQTVHAPGCGLHATQLHERRAILGDQNAAFIEAAMAGLIKVFREQDFTRADRIGGVGDDHVELLFGGRDEAHAIVDDQVQT